MPRCFRFEDRFFYVSSRRFADLLVYGVFVALKTANDDRERAWANRLRESIPDLCQRDALTLETDFLSVDERKFWARVFDDLAYLAFRHEIGADDPGFNDYTAVADASLLAFFTLASVPWQEKDDWHPQTMAMAEREKLEKGRPK
ncbi:hypothetical protein LLG95_09870 [bacterium]|nr:hypothetical protein [bacterium]